MVLEKNLFVEMILPASVMRTLTDEEMEAYRAPYTEAGESRRPTLTWPREIPIDGEPADVTEIVGRRRPVPVLLGRERYDVASIQNSRTGDIDVPKSSVVVRVPRPPAMRAA